jgi:hypothetical protein
MEDVMVYNNKLVTVIKANGKVLREKGETVYIPFGSEYSILLKNLNTVRALATVMVDGAVVTKGYQLIIEPGETFELEGFLKGKKVSHKFKFIEKTKRIQKFRGNKICDGLVQITYQFEKIAVVQPKVYPTNYNYRYDNTTVYSAGTPGDMLRTKGGTAVYSENKVASHNLNDAGITVKGSESNQFFDTGSVGALDPTTYNIVLQLKGKLKKKKLKKMITTKTKISCVTCGKKNKSSNKFCGECGTALFN